MAREMKDSGVEWIGAIPKGWEIKRLKRCATQKIQKYSDEIGELPYIGLENIVGWSGKYIPSESQYDKTQSIMFGKDDILWGKLRPYLAKVYHSHNIGCCSSEFCVIHSNEQMDIRYLWNLLISSCFVSVIDQSTYGTKMPRANTDFIMNTSIPVPPLPEQRRIAAYLDTQCAEIDTVLAKTRASIEEYKKLKQSVITQAVTKGVRGDRPMKDSGVEWIGEIPEEWSVIPSRYLFSSSDTRRMSGDELLTSSQKHGIISQRRYTELENAKVVAANKGLDDWKHVDPYDFIISLRSFQGGLEMSETIGCITWHYIVLKARKKIYNRFYKWLFKSQLYIKALQRTCNYIRDGQDLRYSNFVQVPLFEPSFAEQREIAAYLDDRCAAIDALIDKKNRFLSEMEAYKKSLIYEYVTGKKEV